MCHHIWTLVDREVHPPVMRCKDCKTVVGEVTHPAKVRMPGLWKTLREYHTVLRPDMTDKLRELNGKKDYTYDECEYLEQCYKFVYAHNAFKYESREDQVRWELGKKAVVWRGELNNIDFHVNKAAGIKTILRYLSRELTEAVKQLEDM